jgi:hypothetical protein
MLHHHHHNKPPPPQLILNKEIDGACNKKYTTGRQSGQNLGLFVTVYNPKYTCI